MNVSFSPNNGLVNSVPDVTLCSKLSILVQVTVVPADIVNDSSGAYSSETFLTPGVEVGRMSNCSAIGKFKNCLNSDMNLSEDIPYTLEKNSS